MIKLLFGKAGSGKSHVGRRASLDYGFHFHDADDDLPDDFRRAIENQESVSETTRVEYIGNMIATIRRLAPVHNDICVCQALIRNRFRERILEAIPTVQYVWVDAADELILSRLQNRAGHIASKSYAVMANKLFEIPTVPHVRFENGNDPVQFDAQMKAIFGRK